MYLLLWVEKIGKIDANVRAEKIEFNLEPKMPI